MTHSTQPAGSKPGTVSNVVPALARDIAAGNVLRTFDGDVRIDRVHVTESGFRLLMFADRPIRPCRPEDVVYLVKDGAR